MNNKSFRTFLSIAVGVAVLYFGSRPDSEGREGGVTTAVLVLSAAAALVVWFLTKPGKSAG